MILLRIAVPRARLRSKPIHLGANPFSNPYVRQHDGDYPADDETVRGIVADGTGGVNGANRGRKMALG
jgi:hypothetical protein